MANINTISTVCRKGDIPVGTGLPLSEFCAVASAPKDNAGNILPGYSLQTSSTSPIGVAWNFTGTGGQEITRFQYPSNCPVPFPDPVTLNTDLALITREDTVFNPKSGMIDIYMPTRGVQGLQPTSSIPPVSDPNNSIVFFFDDANAAINVYNVVPQTWTMGWLRAVPSATFRWRAADVLTGGKIRGAGQYVAPLNQQGLFFSCVSGQFSNGRVGDLPAVITGNNNGFWFINYTVGNAVPFTIDLPLLTGPGASGQGTGQLFRPAAFQNTSGVIATRDLGVTAICALPQSDYFYNAAGINFGNSQLFCAIACGPQNQTGLFEGRPWWGYYGVFTVPLIPPNISRVMTLINLNYLQVNTNPGPDTRYCAASGTIRTISYSGTLPTAERAQFFIGGDYINLQFDSQVVTRGTAPTQQTARVAMIYDLTVGSGVTAACYRFVGSTSANTGLFRQWQGNIVQSNYSSDGYFSFCGDFRSPYSILAGGGSLGPNPLTEPFTPTAVQVQTSTADTNITPFIDLPVQPQQVGSEVTTISLCFTDNGVPFVSSGLSFSLNSFCLSFSPNSGDIRESSFPPIVIGGNFLQPTSYVLTSATYFQTQASFIGNSWWYAYVSIWVETAILVPQVEIYIYPDNATSPLAPLQYRLTNVQLRSGKNYLPILGAGVQTIFSGGTGGFRFNSNIACGGGTIQFDGNPRSYFMFIAFSDGLANPVQVRIGRNAGNMRRYPNCWTLEGYPTDYDVTGNQSYFSSRALNAPLNIANQSFVVPNRRFVQYNLPTSLVRTIANGSPLRIFVIPINWDRSLQTYSQKADGTFNGNVANLQDTQGNFPFSALTLARNPNVVYKVSSMLNSDGTIATSSLYAKSRYEIYKIAQDAAADYVSLGIYTNFEDYTDLQYIFVPPGTNIDGAGNIGRAVTNTLTLSTVGRIDLNYFSLVDPFNFQANLAAGDVVTVTNAATLEQAIYSVTNVTTDAPNFVVNIFVTFVSTTFAVDGQITGNYLLDFTLSRNTRQTPFVLKQGLGPYIIGNGTDIRLRDVFMAPTLTSQEKAYRYVPDWETNFLQFSNQVQLGAITTDDTLAADTAFFGSNGSSVLLSKASSNLGGNTVWNVASTSGNVTFNTQRA